MKDKSWTIKRIAITLWVAAGLLFTAWLVYSYQSKDLDKSLLQDSNTVKVDLTDDFFGFTPTAPFKDVLIFYPGALVDPKAYVPLCRKIAEQNIKVYLIKMPWRLASFGYEKPKQLKLFADSSKTYTLAGHSQGAKMAAQFVYENPGLAEKLILIGTSHPRDISLSDNKARVMKIYGSRDGVATEKSIMKNKSKLPASAELVKIDGANHAQFGYYGFQLGDNSAGITREKQQEETLKLVLQFLKE